MGSSLFAMANCISFTPGKKKKSWNLKVMWPNANYVYLCALQHTSGCPGGDRASARQGPGRAAAFSFIHSEGGAGTRSRRRMSCRTTTSSLPMPQALPFKREESSSDGPFRSHAFFFTSCSDCHCYSTMSSQVSQRGPLL